MHRISLTDVLAVPIQRPGCGRCGTQMMLARITPQQDGSEKRMFECPKCGFIETSMAADLLKSEPVKRPAG